ncbi:MAG: patatin-like phospholipase family protein [Rubellimicrobium sp.]|nr:patatin-like phospholipase family protein [Rubellimicrobium sp.]
MDGGSERTAFVFAGGGSLGAIQVGMLQALLEAGVTPDFVVGTSVGALNAAFFAGSPDLEGVARLAGVWRGLRRNDVFPLSLGSALRLLRNPDSLVDPANLRALVAASLPFATIEEARLPLHVMATDTAGMGVLLSSGPTVDSVMASAAIPGVFPPVVLDGRPLVDGAISANTPLRQARELGATRIFVLPTGYACDLEDPPRGVIGHALHAITLLIAWQLMHEIEVTPETVGLHMAPALCPLRVSPFDFSATGELIERSLAGTRQWIERGGLTRQARARELAPHRHRKPRAKPAQARA